MKSFKYLIMLLPQGMSMREDVKYIRDKAVAMFTKLKKVVRYGWGWETKKIVCVR